VVYVPLAQAPSPHLKLVARSDATAAVVVPAIRQALRAVDPSLPVGDVATMAELRDRTFLPASRPASIVGAFAAVAVLLTGLGMYGVLAQNVSQRRREIGIRLALGAAPVRLVRDMVVGALRLVALGSLFGLGGVVLLAPVLRKMVFRMSALDPAALGTAVACMWLIGVAAALLPARRAARVDPVVVLREEG
jgi:ABC-type antimicrobial peptide transport system permease subunit